LQRSTRFLHTHADTTEILVAHNDVSAALTELERRIEESRACRVLFSSEALYPMSDRFSHCTSAELCDEFAPAVRDEFLPRTSIVGDKRLDKI
jgi:hypothetical protein